jgi:hypothetical protein
VSVLALRQRLISEPHDTPVHAGCCTRAASFGPPVPDGASSSQLGDLMAVKCVRQLRQRADENCLMNPRAVTLARTITPEMSRGAPCHSTDK